MNSSRTRDWRRAQRDRYLEKRSDRSLKPIGSETAKPGYFAKVKGVPTYCDSQKAWVTKNWKLIYIRSIKLARAKQLKTFYPRRAWISALEDILIPPEEG
jgi:hypothetical protein